MGSTAELKWLAERAKEKLAYYSSLETRLVSPGFFKNAGIVIGKIKSGIEVPDDDYNALFNESRSAIDGNVKALRKNYWERRELNGKRLYDILVNCFGEDFAVFFAHDSRSILQGIFRVGERIPRRVFVFPDVKYAPEHFLGYLMNLNTMMESVNSVFPFPWRVAYQAALMELGEPLPTHEISLKQRLEKVAHVVAPRFRAQVFVDQEPMPTTFRKSIVVYGDDVTIEADEVLDSIAYNAAKNTMDKFDKGEGRFFLERFEGIHNLSEEELIDAYKQFYPGLPERTFYASCHELNEDYVALVFYDSGAPADLNKLRTAIREAMEGAEGKGLDWITKPMQRRFADWKRNDWMFNEITMRDLLETQFMARISGKDGGKSGFGLYGSRYVTGALGGSFVTTTSFDQENPVYAYIIPRRPMDSNREARNIADRVVSGEMRFDYVA